MPWIRGYLAMLHFERTGQRFLHAILFVVQIVLGGGLALIYGFYLGDTASETTFIAAGIPALALLPLGFVSLPILVKYRRANGSHDFIATLPVPNTAAMAATLTVFTAMAMPGAALVLGITAWRYGFDIDPKIVAALLLSGLMCASLGYAISYTASSQVTDLVNGLVLVMMLLFVPIVAPASRLPGWLAAIDQWLPFRHMATVIRDGSVPGVEGVGRAYLLLAAWTVASWLVAAAVKGTRR